MHMKKRLLALAICITLLLTACGKENATPANSKAEKESTYDSEAVVDKTSKDKMSEAVSEKTADEESVAGEKSATAAESKSGEAVNSKETKKKEVYYRTYKIVTSSEEEEWHSEDYLNLDFHPNENYVSFDMCQVAGFYGLSYFSTECPPKSDYYWVQSYDGDGGMPSISQIYLDYQDETLTIYYCDSDGNRGESGMVFKLMEE